MSLSSAVDLPHYVVLGEALTDFVCGADGRFDARPGGAGWNAARAGAGLGVSAALVAAVSRDPFGEALWQGAEVAGLDLRFLQRNGHAPLLAMVTRIDPPHYFFVGNDSADLHVDLAALPDGWMQAVRVVQTGGLALQRMPDRILPLLETLAARGCRIAFDPNFRAPMRDPGYFPVFEAVARLAGMIKVSDEDLAGLYPGLSTGAALMALRLLAPRADVLLTRGAAGMVLFAGGEAFEQPAFPVAVADTIGCGDAAMAGWVAAVLEALPPGDAVRLAAAAAAVAAMHPGARAPSRAEAAAFL